MMRFTPITETAEKQEKTTTHAVMKNDEKIAHNEKSCEITQIMKMRRNPVYKNYDISCKSC